MVKELKIGDIVTVFGRSWSGGDKYKIRAKVVGKEKHKQSFLYNVKPFLADVKKLYDVDFQEMMSAYRNPKSHYFQKSLLKEVPKNFRAGYY